MRDTRQVTPCTVWMEIPTVVIVVYDAADHHSMQRVTDLLAMEPSAWLPDGCQLALASSGSATASPWPVRRLKGRAKGRMGTVQLFDILNSEATMHLLQWTLVTASTHKVPYPDPFDHDVSIFEPDRPGVWSKLLRKVASKVTLRSTAGSVETWDSEPESILPNPQAST